MHPRSNGKGIPERNFKLVVLANPGKSAKLNVSKLEKKNGLGNTGTMYVHTATVNFVWQTWEFGG